MKVEAIAHKREVGAPVQELTSAEVLLDSGVAYDLAGKPGSRQVTLLSADAWQWVCENMGQEIDWTVRRANILLSGVSFSKGDVGKILQIGELQLEITKETEPCQLMDDQVDGLQAQLAKDWNGGVCSRVIQEATIRVGDSAHFL